MYLSWPSTELLVRSSLMRPGETVLLKSKVEVRSQARRTNKLITIVVPPMKAKKRTLILTDQRLLCVKIPSKGRGVSVKAEFTLLPSDRSRDGLPAVVSVEPKGEREFVVMTVRIQVSFMIAWRTYCRIPPTYSHSSTISSSLKTPAPAQLGSKRSTRSSRDRHCHDLGLAYLMPHIPFFIYYLSRRSGHSLSLSGCIHCCSCIHCRIFSSYIGTRAQPTIYPLHL